MDKSGTDARIGPVMLIVNNLSICVNYYTNSIGLKILTDGNPVVLGAGNTPLLILREDKGAVRRKPSSGLYHVAYLLPSRADLARQLRHFAAEGVPLQGMSDHQVSEALYLSDPEGNGIEIYRDRPREDWQWIDGEVVMTTDPMDVDGVLATLERADEPWEGMPKDTVIGHIHLRVSDLQVAEEFYVNVLGLDVTTHSYRGAIFLSNDGYHHHIGINTWGSAGAPALEKGAAGLDHFVYQVHDEAELSALKQRLQQAEIAVTDQKGMVVFHDPFGIQIYAQLLTY